MGKSPGFWFFTGDWLKDPELRFCSIFARGLLVDLLCLMFEAKEMGYMSNADGTPRTDEEIVNAISGSTTSEKISGLRELEKSGVLSRDLRGALFSRRLARLSEVSKERSKAGSKGGSKGGSKTQANIKQTGKQNRGVTDSVTGSDSDTNNTKTRKKNPTELPEDFVTFWEAYPRIRRTGKTATFKAWKKAIQAGVDPKAIIQAAIGYAKSEKGSGEFSVSSSRFINDGMYDDSIEAWGGLAESEKPSTYELFKKNDWAFINDDGELALHPGLEYNADFTELSAKPGYEIDRSGRSPRIVQR